MITVSNGTDSLRKVYAHFVRESKVVTCTVPVSLEAGQSLKLRKTKGLLLSTSPDYRLGIIPIYGNTATIVNTLHTITIRNDEISPYMKVELVTEKGKIRSMRICKGFEVKLTVHSPDTIYVISDGEVIYTSPPPLLGSPPSIETFIKEIVDTIIMNNLFGLTFTVCSGCPPSTLRNIRFGNSATASGNTCLGVDTPIIGCVGAGRIRYDVRLDSATGLDNLRLTDITVSPIMVTQSGDYRVDFSLQFTVSSLELLLNGNFSFTSAVFGDRSWSLSRITVPGPHALTIRGSFYAPRSDTAIVLSTRNITVNSISIGLNLDVLRRIANDVIRNTLPSVLVVVSELVSVFYDISGRIADIIRGRVGSAISSAESSLRGELNRIIQSYDLSVTIPLPLP